MQTIKIRFCREIWWRRGGDIGDMHGRHRGDQGRYSLLLIDSREARAERNVGVLTLACGRGRVS